MLKILLSYRSVQVALVLVVVAFIGISGVFSLNPSTEAFTAQCPELAVLCVFLGSDNSDASQAQYRCFTRSLPGSSVGVSYVKGDIEMLKQVLSNNRVFGAVVCVLVFIAVGLLYLQSAKRDVARDVPPRRETAKPQQPPQRDNPSTGGHFHEDGTWHAGLHGQGTPPTPTLTATLPRTQNPTPLGIPTGAGPIRMPLPAGLDLDWTALAAEKLPQVIEQIEAGIIEPPDGYHYKITSTGKLLLDENGYPILHKDGEPFFSVFIHRGFAPTRAQYAEYKKVHEQYLDARAWGRFEEADSLKAQLGQMRQTYVGEIPDISSSGAVDSSVDFQKYLERGGKIYSELLREVYRKSGFGYLKE